jgi:hypothetical protein
MGGDYRLCTNVTPLLMFVNTIAQICLDRKVNIACNPYSERILVL